MLCLHDMASWVPRGCIHGNSTACVRITGLAVVVLISNMDIVLNNDNISNQNLFSNFKKKIKKNIKKMK